MMSVFLECDFVQNYLRWTTNESDWLEEAFVTYVAGNKASTYEWQAMNLVRSVDVFSSRPIVVVVFGESFVPPMAWRAMPNVLVYRMMPIKLGGRGVSFNFNKLRAMVSARVAVGVQLDTDQLVAPYIDLMFEGTRREINEYYPWLMLPVHWMSREDKKPAPYWEYRFEGWGGPRSIRWGHAHPTWSYWALPFLCDILQERFVTAQKPGTQIRVWQLDQAVKRGLLVVLKEDLKEMRKAQDEPFMSEDEDMMNVALWRDKVEKNWCKFDLEWGVYKDRMSLQANMYWDTKWYPNGVPILFLSMHNTKMFEITDWLLSLLARCDRDRPSYDDCPSYNHAPRYCEDGSTDERKMRAQPEKYASTLCCCFQPRQDKQIFWAGSWFRARDKVPMKLNSVRRNRTCIFP
uniref:Uncharacterized protein n=1 Tax=Zooxanthella nutricula TaxID=1333877 RepID=A0A7S2K2N4_9DINO